jgi:ligand-binding SRPBCC domain-containing protein
MSEHTLTRAITLDLPREDVFAFFADAGNLERITPPELSFNIVSPQPIVLAEGSLIDYQLKIFGIPLKWRTEISSWNPPFDFTDRQLKGPYSQWIHRHTFTDLGPARTLIEDEVRYRLPLEPFGEIAHFIVRGELDRIFDFRQTAVAKILVD